MVKQNFLMVTYASSLLFKPPFYKQMLCCPSEFLAYHWPLPFVAGIRLPNLLSKLLARALTLIVRITANFCRQIVGEMFVTVTRPSEELLPSVLVLGLWTNAVDLLWERKLASIVQTMCYSKISTGTGSNLGIGSQTVFRGAEQSETSISPGHHSEPEPDNSHYGLDLGLQMQYY
ncbi:hypothetical protein BY996DRAFT_6414229 [Phakopsora pachyrhizi]|nr:hypothetical protein BY996DRAFT_6414229 [Phakopsora pachyrhizi]